MAKGRHTKNNIVKAKQQNVSTPQMPSAEGIAKEIIKQQTVKDAQALEESLKKTRKSTKDIFDDMSQIDDAMDSIGSQVDKNNKRTFICKRDH
jgi:hypothetical protein